VRRATHSRHFPIGDRRLGSGRNPRCCCGSPAILDDLHAFLDARGFEEGNEREPGDYLIEKAFVDRLWRTTSRGRPRRRGRRGEFLNGISRHSAGGPKLPDGDMVCEARCQTFNGKASITPVLPCGRTSKAHIVKSKPQARRWITYRKRPPKKAASPVSKRSDKLYTIAGAVRPLRDFRRPTRPNPAKPVSISAQVEGSGVPIGLPPASTPAKANPES
jgi:hypothetical protein